MRKTKEQLKNFIGTNFEVGQAIGEWVREDAELLKKVVLPVIDYPEVKYEAIKKLLTEFCPGVNDEIASFSKVVGIELRQALFYAASYLERGCSLMSALPKKTKNGHVLMGRNYDFNDVMEEMCFSFTNIKGRYKHLGSTLNLFGRSDGINEHGLAVCKASNGLPVGNFTGGQRPGVTGFSFWIVIRSLLENCKNVEEAITWLFKAPIAYNLNVMLADKSGKIAIMQCIDGHMDYQIVDEQSEQSYLSCTNHTLLEKIQPYEKMIIKNSVKRYNHIEDLFSKKEFISIEDIKNLLATPYPTGLCCHYYQEFFGTLRAMVFDVTEGKIAVTFGSPAVNQWQSFAVEPLEEKVVEVLLPDERAPEEFYQVY
jgi:predicted choloylglycine hydrolase